ncbi:DnaB-like helicase N-terminal domain-containing protein [Paradesertivirga mongoliensis]|uniref:DnaB-like helicase N-terminal domain-containing protein n=1 Tax=Paradesertivirga mongoliensis TaxID=2100740 RepID=A0ABW4ZNQ8_9SPHI|nr:DnaB-like helicase N-terminal domain-containing protein [Pedobacter mongoliensis]
MLSRTYIERAILGACLYCDGFPQVAHILSAKNFISSAEHKSRELFEVMASLYPHTPIDLVTVSAKYKQMHPVESEQMLMHWIFETANEKVNANANVISWAFTLLQLDINNKFRAKLQEWREVRIANHDHVEAASLLEILEASNEPETVFDMVENAMAYFEHHNMEEELEGTRELFGQVSDKCRNIKKVESIKVALKYLMSVTDCSNNQVKRECNVFAQAIADMISTGATNPRYTEAVELILK